MQPNRKYHKEIINENAEIPFSNFTPLNNKGILFLVIVCLGYPLVGPFLPPRHSSNWTAPQSFNDYASRAADDLILVAVILALLIFIYLLSLLRTVIDRRLGYKWVGIFTVIGVKEIKGRKTISLNNGQSISYSTMWQEFDPVEKNEIIKVEKTATYKLIGYTVVQK